MDFDQVVQGRRSIRGYLNKPVPQVLIREVLELAIRAPTSLNTQPWNFYVVAGDVLDRIRKGNVERNLAGVPDSREFRMGPGYAGVHRDRQIGVAKQLFAAMGIERDNKDKRQDWVLRGFRQFDAPVSIVVTYDRAIQGSDIAPFDCGGVVNCLVNAAWARSRSSAASRGKACATLRRSGSPAYTPDTNGSTAYVSGSAPSRRRSLRVVTGPRR